MCVPLFWYLTMKRVWSHLIRSSWSDVQGLPCWKDLQAGLQTFHHLSEASPGRYLPLPRPGNKNGKFIHRSEKKAEEGGVVSHCIASWVWVVPGQRKWQFPKGQLSLQRRLKEISYDLKSFVNVSCVSPPLVTGQARTEKVLETTKHTAAWSQASLSRDLASRVQV